MLCKEIAKILSSWPFSINNREVGAWALVLVCTRSGFGVASAQSQNSKSRSLFSFVNTNCLLSWSRPDFFDTCWPPEVFYCWYYFSPIERKSSIIWLLVSFEWSLIQDCVSSSFLFVSARAKIARGSGVRDVTEPSEYFLLRIFPPLLYYFFCAKRENCLSCVFFFFLCPCFFYRGVYS